ncbi:hypothetical protein M5K25_023447 [Dendrobium thyrsiflorum]|uniref:Uncharacterized protein n=1 Tax=Dendrobium thyrsiflorum TaxID=117978 RepID=A0ABD0U871_DENTH
MNGLDEIPRSDLARRDQTAGSRSRGTAAGGALDRELYSMEGFDLIPPESTSPAALTGWVAWTAKIDWEGCWDVAICPWVVRSRGQGQSTCKGARFITAPSSISIMVSEVVVKEYPRQVDSFVFLACLVDATGGLIFGYDISISGGVTSMDSFLV